MLKFRPIRASTRLRKPPLVSVGFLSHRNTSAVWQWQQERPREPLRAISYISLLYRNSWFCRLLIRSNSFSGLIFLLRGLLGNCCRSSSELSFDVGWIIILSSNLAIFIFFVDFRKVSMWTNLIRRASSDLSLFYNLFSWINKSYEGRHISYENMTACEDPSSDRTTVRTIQFHVPLSLRRVQH